VAPAEIENGTVSELTLNAELLMEKLATDTLEEVTFLTIRVCVSLFPAATEP
jgi:hypothetical protein